MLTIISGINRGAIEAGSTSLAKRLKIMAIRRLLMGPAIEIRAVSRLGDLRL